MSEINLLDFFAYYRGEKDGQPQQEEAVKMLQDALPLNLKQDASEWVQKYRETPPEPETPNLLTELFVPYFWQQDNGPDGWRQCQTSSIAMCLAYLQVPGINDDVDYLKIVQKFGDTTLQSSHQQALKSLGVPAKFKTTGGKDDLIMSINRGYPVPIGILHHGALPVPGPSGGGHYIVVIGCTDTHAICHDPYGELDLVKGTWAATGQMDGKHVEYSWENLLPRWDLNNGTKDGWYWEIDRPTKK